MYDPNQVLDLVKKYQGNISKVAEAMNCSRATVYGYMDRHLLIGETVKDLKERRIDHVEEKLMQLVDELHPTAIIFFLKTQGRNRGWNEKLEHEVNGQGEMVITIKHEDD